jgi:PAS domain S-box-containing protein
MIALNGYRITDRFFSDAEKVLYKGYREEDSTPVIIKAAASEHPNPEGEALLRREYEVAKDLDLNGLLKPCALESWDNGLALVLQDFVGVPLKTFLQSKKMGFRECLLMGISLCQAVGEIHEIGIIHKDINPGNILLNTNTWDVKLTGLGHLSDMALGETGIASFLAMENALAYISPEQTGRMNRSLDYRTDFYSLGVVFYEILTGRLPFRSKAPLELVHYHMAREPLEPSMRDSTIPPVVSTIVMKLLSKTAEGRYRSAWGLKTDLTECLKQFDATGKIQAFAIAQHDFSKELRVAQGLYGREKEIEMLHQAFSRISRGKREMMLVSGYAGVGKTSLVKELYKSITDKGGFFVSGKFDQFMRNIPYGALASAFQGLIRQLLAQEPEEVEKWRKRLLVSLANYGRIIIDVIPELEKLIGPQPTVQKLGAVESQNRFNLVFRKFLLSLCKDEQPLVVFLDDLQWVDTATLNLIKVVMTDRDLKHLFLIGAYRDNEVGPSHPLVATMAALSLEAAPITEISLKPLTEKDVKCLLSDTLNADQGKMSRLAALVVQKTDGNPFFVNQFLTTLYLADCLHFDVKSRKWEWELERIQELQITDNVVDLLIARLQRLSNETQHILRLGACIGNTFDIRTLRLITDCEEKDIIGHLEPAIREGLVLPISEIDLATPYGNQIRQTNAKIRFLHDRVQQAAYSLIGKTNKKEMHLRIGRLLLEKLEPAQIQEQIFEIVSQLNFAKELITAEEERDHLAELNLMACRKAKDSAAFGPAFDYSQLAVGLLGEECWKKRYPMALDLHTEAVEAACLSGSFEAMEALSRIVIENANSALDKVGVYLSCIRGHMAQNQISEAAHTGLEILNMLGVDLPEKHPHRDGKVFIEPANYNVSPEISSPFSNLPEMTDPVMLASIRIISETCVPFYFFDMDSLAITVRKAMDITLENGNCYLSPHLYCMYGLILCGSGEDFESGYSAGKMGLALLERFETNIVKAKAIEVFNMHVRHFKEHLVNTIAPLLEAYRAGLETGDLQYAGYSAYAYCSHCYLLGKKLPWVVKETAGYIDSIRKINHITSLNLLEIFQQTVLNLMAKSPEPWLLQGEVYDEKTRYAIHQEANDGNALFLFHFNKLVLCYLFEKFDQALEQANKAREYLDCALGLAAVPAFYLYDSLVRLTMFPSAPKTQKRKILETVSENQKKMEAWAYHAPMNYLHKYHLVEARRQEILEKDMDSVIEQYEKALELARENEYLNEEALAYELAAKFCLVKGKERLARVYMREAFDCYDRWGAMRKLEHLEENHRGLLWKTGVGEESPAAEGAVSKPSTGMMDKRALDFTTLMKASQAISGEIELNRLIRIFMKILIENVGAEKGFLLESRDGNFFIEARGSILEGEVLFQPQIPLEDGLFLSSSVVHHVARAKKSVLLENPARKGMFANDAYVQSQRPKSILCAPIIQKSELSGIIYLENNLVSGAFTPKRLEVVNLLTSQIAISRENAKFYGDLKKAEEKYRGIFEHATEGIYQTCPDGRILSANPAMAQMFGFRSPDELLEEITEVEHELYVNPERRGEFINLMRRRESVSGFEVEFKRKDSQRFWATLHARPVYDDEENLLFIEGIVTDITEKKKSMDALRESEAYFQKENLRLRSNIKDRYRFGNIIGKSRVMQEVYENILRAAGTDVNVIIYGESGTGKELVARAIHEMSERKEGPFVPVNSGAIPKNLLESEFFGFKKGAFTGATGDKHGYFDLADGGTLFLDELGEISLILQATLLRAIEGGGYRPVGGSEERKTDFRIITATNRNTQDLVRKGLMREDFFYRIHVIPVYLPPLRERKEDIPLLIEHFMTAHGYEEMAPAITGKILEEFLDYDWPGNVRELQNALHRYATLKQLDFVEVSSLGAAKPSESASLEPDGDAMDLSAAVASFEGRYIRGLLEQNEWGKTRVASILGIDRKTLYRKMKTYGITGA